MNLEIRAARLQTRLEDAVNEERTFTALAVPYEEWTELWPGVREKFQAGALHSSDLGVKLRLEHAETIGTITDIKESPEGLQITGKISTTRAGNDAYTLVRDGALAAVSIGFLPDPEGTQITYDDDGTTFITRTSAELREVSLVTFPAYQSAAVEEVRNRKENTTMTTEIQEMRAALSELERSVSLLTPGPSEPENPLAEFRSAGEYLKGLVTGDALAMRAFDSASDITTKETGVRPTWVDRTLQLMQAKMPMTNLFEYSKTLPATGMSIEYPKISANTIKVAEQAKQGDELQKGRLEITAGSGNVKTYGGYSVISRQAVERAPASYLATVHRAQAIQYAAAIEAETVKTFVAAYTAQLGKTTITNAAQLDGLTAESLADLLIDLVDFYDEKLIYPFEGLIVSKDVFKKLAKLDEMPKALQFTGAPDDKIGTLTIERPRATVAGITVHRAVGTSVPTGALAGYSSQAIEILEGGGAPLRLADEDITNLTKIFSVYGYAAHLSVAPDAIVPVKFGA
ncbi:HK97 family phage prohead protease [Trueperella pyogenes]|uniref:HK97 family phage prohead protease n=1 Tax=Trueperella pyogenes TaxID=1661 RepID=UPI00043AD236|nr:HK97 family phage prohead protease [Trueperella pyogenes]AHU90388.1 hypothetical protein CQ11_01370 [Trueperella pyogenes]AWA42775.1 HK97 family phage prohead protease [Trueperella pyogenes]